ncbi:ABC transporter ATP-binding protein [Microbacterium shaanxiense]
MDALRIDALTVAYGGRTVVDGVSITVGAGEVVGIIGESGSGKSTIAMAALGLLPAAADLRADTLEIAGESIAGADERRLCDLRGRVAAMVFQEPMTALNPTMRIGAQIGEVLEIHRLADRRAARLRARELLELVRIPDPDLRMRQYPHQLSGGQRQRVLIAMAIASNPSLLVADEPTTALDVTVQAQILTLLLELRERLGIGILLISHDLAMAGSVCDRIAVMRHGRIVDQGIPSSVLQSPRDPYTAALLACAPGPETPPRIRLSVVDRVEDHPSSPLTGPIDHVESAAGTPFVRFVDVTKRFRVRGGEVQALRGVDFDVRRGETFGVVGESGSGKSTLAQIATRMERPTSGRVEFDGVPLASMRGQALRAHRRRVQIVFQDPNDTLDPRQPVGSSIAEPLRAAGTATAATRARVAECLELVGLDQDAVSRRPHEFSGGQRQRIAIARAITTAPELILLDEPTSALDVSVQAQILNLLVDLQRSLGMTYLFISHDLAVVRHLSHRVAVMKEGQVVELNDAEQIFAHPVQDYTRRLLSAALHPISEAIS